jgi:hypothetical protein
MIFPNQASGAIVVLGIVGYFSGVVRAPLTAIIIVMEMTADRSMILPLFGTAPDRGPGERMGVPPQIVSCAVAGLPVARQETPKGLKRMSNAACAVHRPGCTANRQSTRCPRGR